MSNELNTRLYEKMEAEQQPDLTQKSSANRFGGRIIGEQIWCRNRWLTKADVVTYVN